MHSGGPAHPRLLLLGSISAALGCLRDYGPEDALRQGRSWSQAGRGRRIVSKCLPRQEGPQDFLEKSRRLLTGSVIQTFPVKEAGPATRRTQEGSG